MTRYDPSCIRVERVHTGRDQVAEVLSSRLPISIEKYVRLSLYEMFFNVAEMRFGFFGRAF